MNKFGQSWGGNGIDERRKIGTDDCKPKIIHNMDGVAWASISFLQMFLLFFLGSFEML